MFPFEVSHRSARETSRRTARQKYGSKVMNETVRQLLQEHGRLHEAVETLSSSADLYHAGLTPFAAIRVMLALEERFEIQFPVRMLCRQTFASIDSIVRCLEQIAPAPELQRSRAA
jgi:acyl carrier protein